MSFLLEAWRSLWDSLWTALGFDGKQGTLLLLGLDNAGKTTLLHRIRTGDVRSFPPTDRPSQTESFTFQGIRFQAWDLGGHEAVRHLWQDYVCECNAVVFLLDACDSDRLEEAGFELDALIGEKVVEDIPIAVLCNKCDMEGALATIDIQTRIDYESLKKMQGEENINMFRISVLRGEGYQSAFRWIAKHL